MILRFFLFCVLGFIGAAYLSTHNHGDPSNSWGGATIAVLVLSLILSFLFAPSKRRDMED